MPDGCQMNVADMGAGRVVKKKVVLFDCETLCFPIISDKSLRRTAIAFRYFYVRMLYLVILSCPGCTCSRFCYKPGCITLVKFKSI